MKSVIILCAKQPAIFRIILVALKPAILAKVPIAFKACFQAKVSWIFTHQMSLNYNIYTSYAVKLFIVHVMLIPWKVGRL